MTRLVIDASVLLSATVAAPDTSIAILMRAVRAGIVEMVVCERLVEEVDSGLANDYFRARVTAAERRHFVDALPYVGAMMPDPVEPPRLLRDPGDDYLVALALAAHADAIVTGDKDLLDHPELSPPAITPRVANVKWGLRSSLVLAAQYTPAARKQRTRLYGAMIKSVSERGYHATTTTRVIGLADVSRRAFYQQFSDKEACFLATHDVVVAGARKRVLEACMAEQGWANRLHAACKALLDDAAKHTNGPRLVVVDAPGIGPCACERMQLVSLTFERIVDSAYATAPDGVGFPRLTSRGIVGGVRHVMLRRFIERRERELYTLTDEVLDWIESYRTPAVARLGGVTPHPPAQPVHLPPAFLAREDERARALGAVVQLTLDQGYARLKDAQIARLAGISTENFHKQFASKQECLLAVIDEFASATLESVRPRFEDAANWPEAVYRATDAFVAYLVAHEALLRIAFIDIFEVGPATAKHMTRSVESFTNYVIEHGPEPQRGPQVALDAVTGAVWTIISSYVYMERVSRLPLIVDHLAFIVLAPYVGADSAVEVIETARNQSRTA